jgi:DNA gyrase subunit B
VSGGLHGVGVSCVSARSTDLKVTVYRDKKIFEQEYKSGFLNISRVRVLLKSEQLLLSNPTRSIFTPQGIQIQEKPLQVV